MFWAIVLFFVFHSSGSTRLNNTVFIEHQNCSQTLTTQKTLTVDCRGKGYYTVPPWLPAQTYKLDLSNNPITAVTNGAFKHLKKLKYLTISNCQIQHLDRNSFYGLPHLYYLDLSSNFLQAKGISNYTFHHLVNLQYLLLDRNRFYVDRTYPETALSVLKSLRYLSLEAISEHALGEGFRNLPSLTTLKIFSDRSDSFIINNDTVSILCNQSLKYLTINIENGFLTFIDTGIVEDCKKLAGLMIRADHNSNITMLLLALYGLQGQMMEYVSLPDCNRGIRFDPFKLSEHSFKYLKKICFKRLDVNDNYLRLNSLFARELSSLEYKTCLEEIDLSRNIFDYDYAPYFVLAHQFINIRRIDIYHMTTLNFNIQKVNKVVTSLNAIMTKSDETSVNKKKYFDKANNVSGNHIEFHLPPHIEFLNASFMETSGVEIPIVTFYGGKLTTLDLADAQFDSCEGEIRGLTMLESLNMSRWECENLNPKLIQNLTALKTLDASESQLGAGLVLGKAHTSLRGLTNLTWIKLSKNSLQDLYSDFFFDQYQSLRELYLDDNKFENIPIDISRFSCLDTISLSKNVINTLNKTERKNLDLLQKRAKRLRIDLTGNKLQCTCENRDFVTWMAATRVEFINMQDLICVGKEGKLTTLTEIITNINEFEKQCISETWLIISAVGISVLIVILIISILGYRYRFVIEYTLLRIRRWLKKYEPVMEEYEYDVFISYSSKDYDWVINTLYPKLNEHFRACLDVKDFTPGVAIADNILTAIDSIKRILFIITNNFLESSWGNYEVEMTRMHAFQNGRDNMVIILLKGDISVADMPDCLQSFWWKVVCLKWTDESMLPSEQDLLWAKLMDSISN